MSDVRHRLLIILGALAVGALFVAGLFIHGRGGGALLLVVVGILLGLSQLVWDQIRRQGRPLRIAVMAAIGVLAVVKLVRG